DGGDHARPGGRLEPPVRVHDERGPATSRARGGGRRAGLRAAGRRGRGGVGLRRAPPRLRLRDPPGPRPASAGRSAAPAGAGLPRVVRPGGALPREPPRRAAGDAARAHPLRVRRARRVRPRLWPRPPRGARGTRAGVGPQEAEAEVVRRGRQPRRRARGRRAARRRPRRPHHRRDRRAPAPCGSPWPAAGV
ncbi:MAG: HDIG domain protein, partial [uncultured Thermoleophilia bacterium]